MVYGVVTDAMALALQSGDCALAVTLLEQGRSIIFTGLGRYRSAITEVQEASQALAERFIQLSTQLDALVVGSENETEAFTQSYQDRATR